MHGESGKLSLRGALKEDVPGFNFDNYARNASLPTETTMHLPSVSKSEEKEVSRATAKCSTTSQDEDVGQRSPHVT